jgi:hypothetical protein
MAKRITIGDFLTDGEITRAMQLYKSDRANFHTVVLEQIIRPNMARINQALGQENDPDYLAYMVEWVFNNVYGD